MKLQIHDLCKQFDGHLVLDHVSMELVSGHIYCLMAPSGTGKTTLFRILMGLEHADSGEIIVQRKTKEAGQAAAEKVADWQENETLQNLCIGAVFQEDRLCENLSAASNIRLVCTETITDRELEEAYKAVALTEIWQKPVRELSGGMRRRVSILRALLAESDCVIMDEPLRGLDEKTRAKTIDYILKKTERKTLIFVTHEEKEAVWLKADRTVDILTKH